MFSRVTFSRVMVGLTLLSLSVLCAGVWHVLDAPVGGFVVEGELSDGERQELQSVLANLELDGALSTPLSVIGAGVDSLAWAREVSVRRQWPDKFVVTLHKADPIARWGQDRYLSAFGDLLRLPDQYAGLPMFDVAVATPMATVEVYRLLDQIAAREQLSISQLHQNDQGEWRIQITRGPEVLLGAEQLNERMHRFLLVHRRILKNGDRAAEYVDVRYANGLAVRYRAAQEKASGQQLSHGPVADPLLVAHNEVAEVVREDSRGNR